MKKNVAILGAGPASLIAAYTAEQAGADVRIFTRGGQPSQLFGCQYLHADIGLGGVGKTVVRYQLTGTPEQYQEKVYGSTPLQGAAVSPRTLPETHLAWDIREAYWILWEGFQDRIVSQVVDFPFLAQLQNSGKYQIVISGIPSFVLCHDLSHYFHSVSCWAMGDAPEREQRVPYECPEDTIQCNGTSEVGYYRVAKVFGHTTVEFPGWRPKPPLRGVVQFNKPVSTNCTCHADVIRIGRYGVWQKGVLAHHSVGIVRKAMEEAGW